MVDLHGAGPPERRALRADGQPRPLGDLPGRSGEGQAHSIECRTAAFEPAECALQKGARRGRPPCQNHHISDIQTQPAPANPRSRVIVASLAGTTIEFYDFYAYATAAVLVFPILFFPTGDDTTALLASFGVFGAAMIARPLGAVVFGHFGDRFGRKATLVASLLTMGIATFLIGCLPTYDGIGWWAAFLLLVLRLAQGFALGGEWSGAALVATENAPPGKRAWYGTFPQVGAPLGFIIANGVFLTINGLLPHAEGAAQRSAEFLAWGWRVPFWFSAVMVIIGLWVRLRLVESGSFTKAEKTGRLQRFPLGETVRRYWRQLILGTFISSPRTCCST